MNNAVYADSNRHRVVGYRCFECSGVFPTMWGDTCNGCREKERRHQESLIVGWCSNCRDAVCKGEDFSKHVCSVPSATEKQHG